jgi:small-conductance mechanosensitive channel
VNELHYGSIADLRTRYLVLKKLDGTEVIVPNEMLITNTVINHSFMDRNTRVLLEIQVAYDSDLDLVLTLLRKAALDHPRVLATPEPVSMIIAFADSGVVMSLAVWIADPENGQLVLKSDIFLAILKLFKANHISIPFPQSEIKILNQQ